jgi:hypothetical protein
LEESDGDQGSIPALYLFPKQYKEICQAGLHSNRVVGCHCHHRYSGESVVAGLGQGKAQGGGNTVPE